MHENIKVYTVRYILRAGCGRTILRTCIKGEGQDAYNPIGLQNNGQRILCDGKKTVREHTVRVTR